MLKNIQHMKTSTMQGTGAHGLGTVWLWPLAAQSELTWLSKMHMVKKDFVHFGYIVILLFVHFLIICIYYSDQ